MQPGRFRFVALVPALVGAALTWQVLLATPAAAVPATAGEAPLGTSVDLQEFVSDHSDGRIWNSYDQTVGSAGPTITGRPTAVVLTNATVHIYARGGGHLIEYVDDHLNGRVWNAYDLSAYAGSGQSVEGDPSVVFDPVMKLISVFVRNRGGDLLEFVNDDSGGNLWNTHDLSTDAGGGGTIHGTVSSVLVSNQDLLHVYARATSGDLVEYVNDNAGGHLWNAYDLTVNSHGGGWIAGTPSAVFASSQGLVHIYAMAASGDLVEYVNDNAGGHLWNAYDLTVYARSGIPVGGSPGAVYVSSQGLVHVYVEASNGHLVEYVNDDNGGYLWNAYDLSFYAAGGSPVDGQPGGLFDVSQGLVHIYVRSSAGDLTEYVNDQMGGHLWNAYDLSTASSGPAASGDAVPVELDGLVHVYVGGPPAMPRVLDLVDLAEGQDQYGTAVQESPSGSNCNPYTAYWGRGTTNGCAPGLAAEEWCSDFAAWAWNQVGVDTTGITGWSYTFVKWGQSHDTFHAGATDDPQPGDAVVWGDPSSQYGAHVAIVVGVSQGNIDVVSGNSGPNTVEVWESGYFDAASSTVDGYSIVGYIAPF